MPGVEKHWKGIFQDLEDVKRFPGTNPKSENTGKSEDWEKKKKSGPKETRRF